MATLVRSAVKSHFSASVWNKLFSICRLNHLCFRHIYTALPASGTQILHFHTCNLYYDQHKISVDAEDVSSQNSSVTEKELALEILNNASKVDKNAQSLPLHMIQRKIRTLLDFGFLENEIRSILSSNIGLLHESKLPEFITFLNEYGFQNSDIVKLLQSWDGSLNVNAQKKIETMYNTLLSFGLSNNQSLSLLAHNSQILSMSTRQVISRLNSLKELFKTQDVFTVVLKSPAVLLGDWETFHKTFEYVFHEMKITQPQMVKSQVFDSPLSHVKSRHLFLSRSGQWFTGKLRQGEKSPNPRLSEIVDTADGHFAKKFGNMGVWDYKTFCRLLAKEDMEMNNDEELD